MTVLLLLAATHPLYAAADEVDLELILAVDVSSSMDEAEPKLQRAGYVAAITDPSVVAAIRSGALGRIAVTYIEWAGSSFQVVAVPWRVLDGPESAGRFADELAARPIVREVNTSISAAFLFASALLERSGHPSLMSMR